MSGRSAARRSAGFALQVHSRDAFGEGNARDGLRPLRRREDHDIFILPPSETELHRRLADRGREDAAAIERRFAEAKREIAAAKEPGLYDAFVVNDDLERAVAETLELAKARSARCMPSGAGQVREA